MDQLETAFYLQRSYESKHLYSSMLRRGISGGRMMRHEQARRLLTSTRKLLFIIYFKMNFSAVEGQTIVSSEVSDSVR